MAIYKTGDGFVTQGRRHRGGYSCPTFRCVHASDGPVNVYCIGTWVGGSALINERVWLLCLKGADGPVTCVHNQGGAQSWYYSDDTKILPPPQIFPPVVFWKRRGWCYGGTVRGYTTLHYNNGKNRTYSITMSRLNYKAVNFMLNSGGGNKNWIPKWLTLLVVVGILLLHDPWVMKVWLDITLAPEWWKEM